MLKILRSWLMICFALCTSVVAADKRHSAPIQVLKITTPPVIDGSLDEPLWAQATAISDFVQRLPKDGGTPTEKTVVYIMYTSTDLLIGVRCYDSRPERIVATVMQRDKFDLVQNDQFVVAIDSYNDGRNGYWFSTNPLGVRVDAQFFNEGDIWTEDLDGIWECQSRIDSLGWRTEIKIPFSTLRFEKKDENIFGMNLFRRIIRTNEQNFSPHIPLDYSYGTPNVSVANKYIFSGIRGGKSLYVQPYMMSGYQEENGKQHSTRETKKEVGGEFRYNITDNLTANLTYNTDFAQVELDDRQINLTRFNLFFPERRDFFLENAGLFTFGLPQEVEVFFSRTIGLAQDTLNRTTTVPLLLGGKVTGRAGKFELGLMNVQTRSVGAIPGGNFSVARVKYQVLPRSYIGLINTQQYQKSSFHNSAVGVDVNLYINKDAGISGFVSRTFKEGEESDISNASAVNVTLFKKGERTSFNLALTDIGDDFNPLMGFLTRTDIRKWSGNLKVPWYIESMRFRRLIPEYEFMHFVNHSGELENSLHQVNLQAELQSDDVLYVFGSHVFEYVPFDFHVFESIIVPPGNYTTYRVGMVFQSKQGRFLSTKIASEYGGFYDGTQIQLKTSFQWKVNRHVTLFQDYETSWARMPDKSFKTHIFQSRTNYALNTKFFINALIQYDNESRELGFNLRLNYRLREGRELFLVYNEIFDEEGIHLKTIFNQTKGRSAILKIHYLLNF